MALEANHILVIIYMSSFWIQRISCQDYVKKVLLDNWQKLDGLRGGIDSICNTYLPPPTLASLMDQISVFFYPNLRQFVPTINFCIEPIYAGRYFSFKWVPICGQ